MIEERVPLPSRACFIVCAHTCPSSSCEPLSYRSSRLRVSCDNPLASSSKTGNERRRNAAGADRATGKRYGAQTEWWPRTDEKSAHESSGHDRATKRTAQQQPPQQLQEGLSDGAILRHRESMPMVEQSEKTHEDDRATDTAVVAAGGAPPWVPIPTRAATAELASFGSLSDQRTQQRKQVRQECEPT